MAEEKIFNPTKYKNDFQKEKYDRLIINVPKGEKAFIQEYARIMKKSLNSYVVDLIHADIQSGESLNKYRDQILKQSDEQLFAAYGSHDEEARSEIEKYIEHKKQSNKE